ncbi:hypothetical protein AB6A40_003805 [Gnathostoma spinigerum]|uniref:Uncharacterized protein n=1 Tax=Gnathostoma spinigerum TaxID=75299 RepID=A0ABD6EI84_9BILA
MLKYSLRRKQGIGNSFVEVVRGFLDYHKDANYVDSDKTVSKNYGEMENKIFLNVHMHEIVPNAFKRDMAVSSEKQGKCFYHSALYLADFCPTKCNKMVMEEQI